MVYKPVPRLYKHHLRELLQIRSGGGVFFGII